MTADTLLLMTTSYPRAGDGSEAAGSFVADLALALAQRVPVRVLAPGEADCVEVAGPNLSIWRFPAPPGTLVNLRWRHPGDALRVLAVLRAGAAVAQRAADDGRVRHSLACWALPSGFWARRLLRKRGIAYSVWMLGSDVWSLRKVPVVRSVLATVMRDASRRYADGLQLGRDSEAICGNAVDFLPSTRMLHADASRLPAAKPPYKLVFIGRWHPNKGVDLLLDALALLQDEDWNRIDQVSIHGGGPLHDLVHAKAERLRGAGRPIHVGRFIPKQQAEQAIVEADYLIIPSRIESIPVIFSDAMKLGRPVIATPVGDLPEWIGGANPCGIGAATVDAAGIADALRRALATSPADFASAVQKAAEQFDMGRIADRIVAEVMRD